MRTNAILAARVALLLATIGAAAVATGVSAQNAARFPVIVVFADDAPLEGFSRTFRSEARHTAAPQDWRYLSRGTVGAVQSLETRHSFAAEHVFGSTLRGFSARLSARQIQDLQNDPLVAYVEADGIMTTQAQTLPWGIAQIDADLSTTQAGNGSGTVTGVNVYVIDTGIDTRHTDLNVVQHVNFAGGVNRDCHGHGTHVAGTIAAKDNTTNVVGVAPGARLTGVKVLSCGGSGTVSGVIKGLDWVAANRVLPAVANMSLGGSASTALDDAVKRAVDRGVLVAVAAGNSMDDACNYSPARAGTHPGVVTVAATDAGNEEASFSNYGDCVDIWAPGVNILSTRLGGGTRTMSGTSMASPHAAGTAALYRSLNPNATPADVEMALKDVAIPTGTFSKDDAETEIVLVNAGTF